VIAVRHNAASTAPRVPSKAVAKGVHKALRTAAARARVTTAEPRARKARRNRKCTFADRADSAH
jgi:hypothetical protein